GHVPALRHRRVDRPDHAGRRADARPRGEQPADVPALHPQHGSGQQRRDPRADDSRGARVVIGAAGGYLAGRPARQRSALARDRERDRARAGTDAAARTLAGGAPMKADTHVMGPQEFSLVLGGPLYQIWRRLFLAGPALELLSRRMISIPLVAWLPLLVLTTYQGLFVGHTVAVPFIYDFSVHARFLVAVPILLLAEIVVHQRIRRTVQQFLNEGLVTAEILPGFRAAITRTMRLRNSLVIEVGLAVFAFGFGWAIWRGDTGLTNS